MHRRREPVLELEASRSWFRDYKTSTSTRRTGEICRFGSGAEHMPAGELRERAVLLLLKVYRAS